MEYSHSCRSVTFVVWTVAVNLLSALSVCVESIVRIATCFDNFFLSLLNFKSGDKSPTAGEFIFLWLLRGRICVAFHNTRTLNLF